MRVFGSGINAGAKRMVLLSSLLLGLTQSAPSVGAEMGSPEEASPLLEGEKSFPQTVELKGQITSEGSSILLLHVNGRPVFLEQGVRVPIQLSPITNNSGGAGQRSAAEQPDGISDSSVELFFVDAPSEFGRVTLTFIGGFRPVTVGFDAPYRGE